MKLQALAPNVVTTRGQKPAEQEQPAAQPRERFEMSSIDVKSGVLFGALGVVPVVGAFSNFGAGMESGFNDNQLGSKAGGVGFLANLAGTATLVGGFMTGNETAKTVGFSLLGISGLTAAYAGFF